MFHVRRIETAQNSLPSTHELTVNF